MISVFSFHKFNVLIFDAPNAYIMAILFKSQKYEEFRNNFIKYMLVWVEQTMKIE